MKTEPFLSGKYGWDLGESGWKAGADENFLKFGYMLNRNVDGFVSSLPVSPTDGTAYYLSTDSTLNARVDGAWYKFSIPKGFEVVEKATGNKFEYNGSSFTAAMSLSDKTKLDGIATAATANASDASLRDRTTHTGSQATSTVTGLDAALATKAPLASPTFTGTPTAPTASTADNTTKIATTAFVKAQGYLTSASAGLVTSVATRTGDVVLTKADVGLSNVDNTADTAKPVSTVQQTALDLKANLASPTFTGTVVLPSTTSIGSVSSTELGYLDGVTSPIQGQINSLSGASGAFAPINSPTFTGTVGGITSAMVGLGNVDNTTDINKPISTLTQATLNLKANIASPSFTGNVTFASGARITGDFSNATFSSRTLFQASSANLRSSIGVIPNGTSTDANLIVFNNSNPDNSSYVYLASSATESRLSSSKVGTGTFLPLAFYTSDILGLTLDTSGNLNITRAGAKITGDFSNSTLANRNFFQTSGTNGNSNLALLPNGTGNAAGYAVYNNSSPINFSFNELGINSTEAYLNSSKIGSGTYLPLNFYTSGTQRISILANGDITHKNDILSNISDGGCQLVMDVTGATGGWARTKPLIRSGVTDLMGCGYLGSGTAPDYWVVGTGASWYGAGTKLAVKYATGNVLINTTIDNGTDKLQVSGTSYFSNVIKASSDIAFSNNSYIYSYQGGTLGGVRSGMLLDGGNSLIDFFSGGATPKARLTANGNFVLGGTTEVGGGKLLQIRKQSLYTDDGNAAISISASATGGVSNLIIGTDDTANISWISSLAQGTSWAGRPLCLQPNNGNVTIGSTYTFGDKKLNVNGEFGIYSGSAKWFTIQATTAAASYGEYRNEFGTAISYIGGCNGGVTGGYTSNDFGIQASAGVLRLFSNTNSIVNHAATRIEHTSGDTLRLEKPSGSSISFTRSGTQGYKILDSYSATGDLNFYNGSTVNEALRLTNSGVAKIQTPTQTLQNLGSIGSTCTINTTSGSHVLATSTTNCTWTFTDNLADSTSAIAITLELTNGGAFTQTWPSGTRWAGGTAPALTASGTDILVFTKAGTANWRGYLSSKDSK